MEDYSNLNLYQLKEKREQLIKDISKYKNLQMAKKISLNSLYGSMGNQYFRYFDLDNAIAITTAGQLSIRWIENKINEYMNQLLKTGSEDYVISSDTDSVVGSTLVDVNGTQTKISDLFDSLSDLNFIKRDDFGRDYVKSCRNITTLCYKDGKIIKSGIKYVMKHRVKKKLYRIYVPCEKKELILTEDHSLIVRRDGKIIEISPKEVINSDKIIINTLDTDRSMLYEKKKENILDI